MPKKRSSWGQQEYVPPGNGDASGEYANDEGSNTHFTNFKKPDESNSEQTKSNISIGNKPKIENQIETETSKDIESIRKSARDRIVGKCQNSTRENDSTLREVIRDSNDESVEILDKYLEENDKLKIKFGNAGRNAAGCAWGSTDVTTNHNVHTIRHELGHTYDCFYGSQAPKENKRQLFMSQDYASVKFVDSETGKTMNETLHEELGVSMYKAEFRGWKVSFRKQGIDKRETKLAAAKRIDDIFNKYSDKIFDEITGIPNSRKRYNDLRKQYREINYSLDRDLLDTDESREFNRLKSEVYKEENEYAHQMFKSGASSVTYSDSPKVQQARARMEIARTKYNNLRDKTFKEKMGEKELAEYEKLSKDQYSVYKKIEGVAGVVGDTLDYLGVGGTSFYSTNGHGSNYFKDRREGGYAMEIFANMFDCYMSKDSWKKECIKEMFPKSVKIFEKIYYKKGKQQ